MKYTVFVDSPSSEYYQVVAETAEQATAKAERLYQRRYFLSLHTRVQEYWLDEAYGEDRY